MRVDLKESGLVLHLGGRNSQRAPLRHYHYDTFSFATENYDDHMEMGLIDYADWRNFLLQFERDYKAEVVGIKWFVHAGLGPLLLQKQTL